MTPVTTVAEMRAVDEAALAAAAGVSRWHVSLTHTAVVAEAVVVAE